MRVFMRLDHSVDSLSVVNAVLLPPAGGCCRCMKKARKKKAIGSLWGLRTVYILC